MSQSASFGDGRKTPGFAKGLILFQTLIILFLSSWIYEEYLNNIYLQAYVNNTFEVYGLLIAGVVIVTALGSAFVLLRVLKSTHKQIGALVNQQDLSTMGVTTGSGPVSTTTSKSDIDLHPMVAALKADLAHQSSMQPLPPLEVKGAPPPPPVQAQPALPAAPKPLTGTPSTVITGTMPVLKRVNTDQDKNQNSR